jgi:ABC-type branched-subunit amino acid transport system ATPase component
MLLVEQNARAAFRIADRGYALVGGAAEPARAGSSADDARATYGFVSLSGEAQR